MTVFLQPFCRKRSSYKKIKTRFLTRSDLFNNVLSTLLFEIKDCHRKKEIHPDYQL